MKRETWFGLAERLVEAVERMAESYRDVACAQSELAGSARRAAENGSRIAAAHERRAMPPNGNANEGSNG